MNKSLAMMGLAASLALGGAMVSPALAAPSSAARLAAFAKLPDWSGLWKSADGTTMSLQPSAFAARPGAGGPGGPGGPGAGGPGGPGGPGAGGPGAGGPGAGGPGAGGPGAGGPGAGGPGGGAPPGDRAPYKPDWAAKYTKMHANTANETDTNTIYCAAGMPRLLGSMFDIDISVTPEETLMDFSDRSAIHIWTDGRAHPPADALWPMINGDSIGHWEGQTLVVDTISMKGGTWLDATGATLSDQAEVKWRLTMVDHDHLRNEVTITDPMALTGPWKFTRMYQRITDENRFIDDDCTENPRFVQNGSKLGIVLEGNDSGSK